MANYTTVIYIVVTVFIVTSCSDVPEFPDEDPPVETYITFGPQEGAIVLKPSVTFQFAGNNKFVGEFSYRFLPQRENWSEWSPLTTVELEYLDQGSYMFEVKGRYEPGNEDDMPAKRAFSIDIPGPGILMEPLKQTVIHGQEFRIDLVADDVEDLALARLVLTFEAARLQAVDAMPGAAFLVQPPAFFKAIDNTEGIIDLSISSIGTEPSIINGIAVIATIRFESLSAGETKVDFDDESEFRDPTNTYLHMVSRLGSVIEVLQATR